MRNSTAPRFMACAHIGTSACPVMNMIGRGLFASTRWRWSSMPLCPRNLTSSTRHKTVSGRPARKNSGTEANSFAFKPTEHSRRPIACRIALLSSTTRTVSSASISDDEGVIGTAPLHLRVNSMPLLQRDPNAPGERACRKRFFQEAARSAIQRTLLNFRVPECRHDDNWRRIGFSCEMAKQIQPAHPGSCTSTSMHDVPFRSAELRNSSAEGNERLK